jgi:cation:H+ antiporter
MTPSLVEVWSSFAFCVAVIAVAGVKLTQYGDAIADKTGLGRSWIGLALIATVTSLPELASGITATAAAALPDIAAGDALGSCVFNLLILAMMDLLERGRPALADARREHVLSASLGILLIGVAALGLISGRSPQSALTLPGISLAIGWTTPVLILLYAFSIRTLYRYQEREVAGLTEAEADRYPRLGLGQIVRRYVAAAAFVVAAGIWLPYVSADISDAMGWGHSFTGTLFTALCTSLPELIVTVTSLRIGAIDLAIGNLLGSNLFNILILAVDDIAYAPAPLLASVSEAHLASATSAMTMSAVVIAGIFFGTERRVVGFVGWVSLMLFVLFAINSRLVYLLTAS